MRGAQTVIPAQSLPPAKAGAGIQGRGASGVTGHPPAFAGVGRGLDSSLRGNDGPFVIPAQSLPPAMTGARLKGKP